MSLLTNLVADWEFDESSGNAADSSGNSNTLTNVNSTAYSSNAANLVKANSNYFKIVNADQTELDITTDFAINLELQLSSQPTGAYPYYHLINKWSEANQRTFSVTYTTLGGTPYLYMSVSGDGQDGGPTDLYVLPAQTFSNNTLYHLGISWDAAHYTTKFYIDGALADTVVATGNLVTSLYNSTADVIIGAHTDAENPLHGCVDGLIRRPRIYKRQLSVAEFGLLYNGGAGVPYSGLASVVDPFVEVLVVGAGGGGGRLGGGGGAGGYQYSASHAVVAGAYTVTVGNGGNGSTNRANKGSNGEDSIFDTITGTGGGGAGSFSNVNGANGGNGGGGAPALGTGGIGSQGFDGGDGDVAQEGGGGAGSSADGTDGNTVGSVGGNGGNGTSNSISGSAVTYAGGGGAGADTTAGTGGTGGGGNGAIGNANGANGTANTGSGGGGSRDSGGTGGNGGNGGSGIVIISYTTDGSDGVSTSSTGGTVTTSGGQTIHTFTTSGTFTVVESVASNSAFLMFF